MAENSGTIATVARPNKEQSMAEKMEALIQRVESGEGWDSRLDGDILRHFGFTWRGMDYWHADNTRIWKGETCFTAKIDAVVSLIEQKLPGADWKMHAGAGSAHVTIGQQSSYARTPARALLAATLRAIKEQSHGA